MTSITPTKTTTNLRRVCKGVAMKSKGSNFANDAKNRIHLRRGRQRRRRLWDLCLRRPPRFRRLRQSGHPHLFLVPLLVDPFDRELAWHSRRSATCGSLSRTSRKLYMIHVHDDKNQKVNTALNFPTSTGNLLQNASLLTFCKTHPVITFYESVVLRVYQIAHTLQLIYSIK